MALCIKESSLSQGSYEVAFKRERLRFFIFAGLAVLAPIIALAVPYRPDNITFDSWFACSGAAMVVLALLAEANAIKIFNIFNPSGFVGTGFNEFSEKYFHWPSRLNKTAFTLIAFGTLIWGYGDIPFLNA